jgi:hypothetical protein
VKSQVLLSLFNVFDLKWKQSLNSSRIWTINLVQGCGWLLKIDLYSYIYTVLNKSISYIFFLPRRTITNRKTSYTNNRWVMASSLVIWITFNLPPSFILFKIYWDPLPLIRRVRVIGSILDSILSIDRKNKVTHLLRVRTTYDIVDFQSPIQLTKWVSNPMWSIDYNLKKV